MPNWPLALIHAPQIDHETNEMRARLRELDLKEGRRATSIRSVSTDSMTVDSRESVPTELKSFKVSGDEVVTILQFKTLQDLQSKLGKIWRKAALGELDLVTTAQSQLSVLFHA